MDTLRQDLSFVTEAFLRRYIGKEMEVLVESRRQDNNLLQGYSENYVRCLFNGSDDLRGSLRKIKAKSVKNNNILSVLTC